MSDELNDQPSGETALTGPEEILGHLMALIAPYCPNTDEESLFAMANAALSEQAQIYEQIIPTLQPGHPATTEYPTLRLVIRAPDGREGTVAAPKRLEGIDDPGLGIAQAFMVSFLMTPSARATLRAWGFNYRFEQVKQALGTTPIIRV